MNEMRRATAGALYVVLMQSLMLAYPLSSGLDDLQGPTGKKEVCALSDQQQEAAPKAFAPFATMVKGEPRCNNCHGAVNPFVDNTNHLGGPMNPSLRGKMGPDGATQSQCMECHNPPWVIPSPGEWFTNKNVIQLCQKMKSDFSESAQHFLNHVRSDQFSLVGFAGTRGLNDTGQVVYEEKRKAPYKIEPPKFTVNELVDQAEEWVNAMGGKFVGDADCGCVPHHYTLSIDMHAVQDTSAGTNSFYIEQSAHAEIPLNFKDDGTLDVEATVPWTQSGHTDIERMKMHCTLKGSLELKFRLKGTLNEATKVLHLVSVNNIVTGSATNNCTNGMNTTIPFPGPRNLPEHSWDMPAFVGVEQSVPMPYQGTAGFTSSYKVKIIQTD